MKPFSMRFYSRDTITVAKDLLGKVLQVNDNGVWRTGIIVENEAYLENDPSCHAYQGLSKRNQSMFKDPGTVYVFTMHGINCVNAVTRKGEAVLIRAIQPLENNLSQTNGPGRLCKSLNITRTEHDGMNFTGNNIQIVDYDFKKFNAGISKRIGISKGKDLLLRFYVKDNPFLSR